MIRSKNSNSILVVVLIMGILILSVTIFLLSNSDTQTKETILVSKNQVLDTSYSEKLFDNSYVHTLDIRADEEAWAYMVDSATEESYIPCSLVIDGEVVSDVAIRPKGNSSLAVTQSLGSDRFSFKIEFDHFTDSQSYYGLDKLSLNNLSQDPSCMKDLLAYDMMNSMGVATPLASYINVTLNGENFGLYLAVEAVEEAFMTRNFGSYESGKLYKPDSLVFDDLDMAGSFLGDGENPSMMDNIINISSGTGYEDYGAGDRADFLYDIVGSLLQTSNISCDVAGLKYLGDDPILYNAIFDNAVFAVTPEDKNRLISSIRSLNESENLEDAVNIDQVLRYFAVQSFVMNYDSYVSIFAHNYYLYEDDGHMSMIPWDYNLAFGSFYLEAILSDVWDEDEVGYSVLPQDYSGMDINVNVVNYPIDDPTITIPSEERPMISKLLENDEYFELYNSMFEELISNYFESGYFHTFYKNTFDIIYPYIASNATTYTLDQFEAGASTINQFCTLRAQSIRGQLDGSIPSTLEGQSEYPELLIDTGDLDVSNLVDFSSMVYAVLGADISEIKDILDIMVPDDSDGTIASALLNVQSLMTNSSQSELIAVAAQIIKSSTLIRDMLWQTVSPALSAIVAIIVLIIALICVSRYRRIKPSKGKKQKGDINDKTKIPTRV